jgi:hypothetical protein
MQRDVKEVVGALMRVLDGAEISQDELTDLGFEAEGDLQEVLNQAYITLLEFVHDRPLRLKDDEIDRKMRAALQECLNEIIRVYDRNASAVSDRQITCKSR